MVSNLDYFAHGYLWLLSSKILVAQYCFLLPQVLGAYFEKLGSKSFAVYSIAVTDANNSTWFVKRRYCFHVYIF